MAFGSGTLIDVNDQAGLVITNWHVVADARGPITVVFPDGFQSPAQVLKTDRDWDLAALAIRRPNATPVRLAARGPRPGEMLSIAGYGSGQYRAVSGRCTQYVSPGEQFPYEMIELEARARQGDSGGPIFNGRGELAGVLFGEGGGHTSGSYSGRVSRFLTSLRLPTVSAPVESTSVAPPTAGQSIVGQSPAALSPSPLVPVQRPNAPSTPPIMAAAPTSATSPWLSAPSTPATTPPVPVTPSVLSHEDRMWTASHSAESSSFDSYQSSPPHMPAADDLSVDFEHWQQMLGATQPERIKTILAAIGVLFLLFHTHRWVNAPAKSA